VSLGRPSVTVCIPTYNYRRFLRQSVESIWKQTEPPEELCVVDDGSNDGSWELLEQLRQESPLRMKVFRGARGGISAALNVCAKAAVSDWLVIQAADDYAREDRLERLLKGVPDQAVLAHSEYVCVDGEGRRTGYDSSHDLPPASGRALRDVLLLRADVRSVTVALRRNALEAIGWYDESLPAEDWQSILKLAQLGEVHHCKEQLVFRRVHGANASVAGQRRQRPFSLQELSLDIIDAVAPADLPRDYLAETGCGDLLEGLPRAAGSAASKRLERDPIVGVASLCSAQAPWSDLDGFAWNQGSQDAEVTAQRDGLVLATMRIASGFLQMLPNQLHKDEGLLPYFLARNHGYQSELVYWMARDKPLIVPEAYDDYVRRVRVSVSPSGVRHRAQFLRYIALNARSTDVLMVYHLTSESISNAILFKRLNPRGLCVLKLDMDQRGLVAFEKGSLFSKRGALMALFRLAPFDFMTIETERMYESLIGPLGKMGHKLHVLPIGINCVEGPPIEDIVRTKKKVILTAGRLGVVQKNNELMLEALERLSPALLEGYEIWLVGSRTPAFDEYLKALSARRPDLFSRILLRDFVTSRAELSRVYQDSEIYCLSSRWESFAIVLAEAAFAGCYVVSTDVGVAREVTGQGRGALVPVGDVGAFARALERAITREVDVSTAGMGAHGYVKSKFDWTRVAERFHELVLRYRSDRSAA
jgi:L-malate glycosyltransferase